MRNVFKNVARKAGAVTLAAAMALSMAGVVPAAEAAEDGEAFYLGSSLPYGSFFSMGDEFSVEFTDTEVPEGAETIDVSANKDGSILCYAYEGTLYVSTDGAEGTIYLNPDSSGLFDCFYGQLSVIETNGMVDSSLVENARSMFCGVGTDESDLSWLDTSGMTDMTYMFEAYGWADRDDEVVLDVSGFDTSNVISMAGMFMSTNLTDIRGIENFDTSNVVDMSTLFEGSDCLTGPLDLNGWDLRSVENFMNMFWCAEQISGEMCVNIEELVEDEYDGIPITSAEGMFGMTSMTDGSEFVLNYVSEASKNVALTMIDSMEHSFGIEHPDIAGNVHLGVLMHEYEVAWDLGDEVTATAVCGYCGDEIVCAVTSELVGDETVYTATYEADGETYTDTLVLSAGGQTGQEECEHDYEFDSWTDINYETTEVSATLVCKNCGESIVVPGELTYDVYTEATEEEYGELIYHAYVEYEGQSWNESWWVFTPPIHEHEYVYVGWDIDYETNGASAVFECGLYGDDVMTVPAEVTSEVTKEATEDEPGEILYTATVEYGGEVYTETWTGTIPVKEPEECAHEYVFEGWDIDYGQNTAKAVFVCASCGELLSIDADVTYEVTAKPTEDEPGEGVYTAFVEYGGTIYSESWTVAIPRIHDHVFDYGNLVWEWHMPSGPYDFITATATAGCIYCDEEETYYMIPYESIAGNEDCCITTSYGGSVATAHVVIDGTTYSDTIFVGTDSEPAAQGAGYEFFIMDEDGNDMSGHADLVIEELDDAVSYTVTPSEGYLLGSTVVFHGSVMESGEGFILISGSETATVIITLTREHDYRVYNLGNIGWSWDDDKVTAHITCMDGDRSRAEYPCTVETVYGADGSYVTTASFTTEDGRTYTTGVSVNGSHKCSFEYWDFDPDTGEVRAMFESTEDGALSGAKYVRASVTFLGMTDDGLYMYLSEAEYEGITVSAVWVSDTYVEDYPGEGGSGEGDEDVEDKDEDVDDEDEDVDNEDEDVDDEDDDEGVDDTDGSIDIAVSKVWDDADDTEGLRPDSITAILTGSDGSENTAKVTASEGWTYTFTDLPAYDAEGEGIVYAVSEADVPEGYTAVVSGSMSGGYTITNIHDVTVTEGGEGEDGDGEVAEAGPVIYVEKVWDDENNAERLRPESVSVTLYREGEAVHTAVLSEDNGWVCVFDDIDVGVNYYVQENSVPEYYSMSSEAVTNDDGSVTYVITNTCTYEKAADTIDIEIDKVWDDNGSASRPDSIQVVLYRDGLQYQVITVSASDDWMNKIHGLEGGHTYQIAEDVPEGYVATYEASIDESACATYTVVNYSEEIADELGIEGDTHVDGGIIGNDGAGGVGVTDTGDAASLVWNIILIIVLTVVVVIVIVILVKSNKRGKGNRNGAGDGGKED